MRARFSFYLWFFIVFHTVSYCQPAVINKVDFFIEAKPLSLVLTTNWDKVFSQKYKPGKVYSATLNCKLPDSNLVNEKVKLEVRGHFRRDNCHIPPLKIKFTETENSVLHPLKELKLVSPCKPTNDYEQFLFKEFIVYKIYNLLTDKSFRVRLLEIDYRDSLKNESEFSKYAFLIEDIKELAKRHNCKVFKALKLHPENTDRSQMTLLTLFQYMIGNTDWGVSVNHNIKHIQPKDELAVKPFSIPYDFDFCGLVNTDYAIPDPQFNTDNIQERIYRGFARTPEELNEALEIFKQNKEAIYALINNFDLLNNRNKKSMISYLESFFILINKPGLIKFIFIDKARKN